MKKTLLVVVMLLGLIACGGKQPVVAPTPAPAPAPTPAVEQPAVETPEALLVGDPSPIDMGPWKTATFTRIDPHSYKITTTGLSESGLPGTIYIKDNADGWWVFTKADMAIGTYNVTKTDRICRPCPPWPPVPKPLPLPTGDTPTPTTK